MFAGILPVSCVTSASGSRERSGSGVAASVLRAQVAARVHARGRAAATVARRSRQRRVRRRGHAIHLRTGSYGGKLQLNIMFTILYTYWAIIIKFA